MCFALWVDMQVSQVAPRIFPVIEHGGLQLTDVDIKLKEVFSAHLHWLMPESRRIYFYSSELLLIVMYKRLIVLLHCRASTL